MRIEEFIKGVVERREAKPHRILENIKSIKEISRSFHRDAGIKPVRLKLSENMILIETGHQPLFLPFPGLWRKAYLADYIGKIVGKIGYNAVSVFGFMDYDISSSKLLYQNRVPSLNKAGYRNIGLKRPENSTIWRRFNTQKKPERTVWEKITDEILEIYGQNERAKVIAEELWKSYDLAENLADINAIFFARISQIMGIDTAFFRCSDVQKVGLFRDTWEEICRSSDRFSEYYKQAVETLQLRNFDKMEPDGLPFWYHCECGGKVQLSGTPTYRGECRLCGRTFEFRNVEEILEEFRNLSPKAVMRNVAFFEGLKTDIFISGSGGSLKYGQISTFISKKLGFSTPTTLYWRGKDIYMGQSHIKALETLKNKFNISDDGFFRLDEVRRKIQEKRHLIAENLKKSQKDKKKKYLNHYKQSHSTIRMAANIFLIQPSLIDVLASYDVSFLKDVWRGSLKDSEVSAGEGSGFYEIARDILYGEEKDLEIYRNLQILEKESLKIDPLKIL